MEKPLLDSVPLDRYDINIKNKMIIKEIKSKRNIKGTLL